MTMHLHILKGCSPAPLANYLKALGILRLVGEQADAQARGWWDGERFCLLTKLSNEELGAFFLEKYEPTPLVAPWNGGSGFFEKDNDKAITAIKKNKAPRLEPYRKAIRQAKAVLNGMTVKPNKKEKLRIQRESVFQWRGKHKDWLDSAYVLNEDREPAYPSLLGTGGNDGRLDFTNNFMQQLCVLFDMNSEQAKPKAAAKELLANALWDEQADKLAAKAIGQFQPGAAGGANSSTGFDGGNLVNPWDFVLMLEGAVLFTCRATRRMDPNAFSKASAPFAVRPHAAGFATPGSEKAQRGEQWMPLWRQPATLAELATMIGEARIQLDRQPANRPIDMVRAISRLGVARGVEAFVRYGYLKRNGESILAVPLGRVQVRHHPRAYLIDDLAAWMDRVQRRSRDKTAPARLVHAERRLADAVFAALTHDHTPDRWQAILLAAAEIEAMQATGTGIEAGPIPALRPDWVSAVAEDSAEFRLALALGSAAASYYRQKPSDPIRHHLLPLKEKNPRRFKIVDKKLANDPRVVANGRHPLRDLAAIVERRLIEAAQQGQRRSRLVAAAGCGARFDDLTRFLSGAVDLDRLFGLARAFMAIDWKKWDKCHAPTLRRSQEDDMPEECWLAVRLCCLPFAIDENHDIPADPRIVRLLPSGNAARAIEIARQRLRSVGIRPPLYAGVTDAFSARFWAAALAFPIHRSTAQLAMELLDPSKKKGPTHA
jgi:CRISPR-associated protein Csx17